MFDGIVDSISNWIKGGMVDAIMSKVTDLFTSVNNQIGDVAVNVGQTPSAWNPGIYGMIRTLSDMVIIPVAGIVLTFIMCYELIHMIIEKNNMHEFDTFNIYKWVFKTFIAVYILTHTYDIVMAVFELAQDVIGQSAGIISNNLDVEAALTDLEPRLLAMGVWELIGLWLEMNIVDLCLKIMSILIFVITFGRMVEIYLTVSVAPIPLSTMANHEWGQMGTNYLRSLFAVAFQGFLIMVCIAIYAVLVQNIAPSDSVHAAIWGVAGYSALLCFALFKTGSLSKSIFNAH